MTFDLFVAQFIGIWAIITIIYLMGRWVKGLFPMPRGRVKL